MKRFSLYLLALLTAAACQMAEQPEIHRTAYAPEFAAQTEEFDAQTRTALAPGRSIIWTTGDQIALFQGRLVADKLQIKNDQAGTASGTFEMIAKGEGESISEFLCNVAIYPYKEALSCSPIIEEDEVSGYQISGVTISETQYYAQGSFSEESFIMAALTSRLDDHTLRFKNVCGALKLQLKGTAKVKTIELRGNNGELLSGNATVTVYPDGVPPTITMSKDAASVVTLDCGEGVQLNETEATEFLIAIPPTTFEKGFTVTLTDTDEKTIDIKTSNPNPVRRSYIHSMPEVTLAAYCNLVQPYIEMGAIRKAGDFAVKYYGKQYYRTPRYLRPTEKNISIKVLQDCDVRVSQYDSDYKFIGLIEFKSATSGKALEFNLDDSCGYIRLTLRKNSALTEFELPEVYISNIEEKEYRETRSADEGYQKLIIPIEVEDEILADYGIIALPETYSNTGEPTRLIIFCHGAAVNYPSSVSRFVDTDINPEYWLKEGYAIMDIEGNPFDNTNEHFYIPQARQTYEAAYDWVTSTYNIKTDGVFLGGRSMGGGMCFELLQSDIPIIAACPVVPACNTLWYWNYCNAARKEFCTSKMGFTGTAPTWTSNKKLTDEEYQYLYDNFDQMLKYAPFWRAIENLPDKDQLFSVGRVSANTAYDEAEYNLYSSLSFNSKAPVKIFTCYEDTTVPYQRNALLMYNMLQNGGVESELSLVHTDASTPHRYELQDSQAFVEVTTSSGETMQAPWVYVDMLEFWRKYE